jgi:hypothetical protein
MALPGKTAKSVAASTSKQAAMRVDVHANYWTDDYLELLAAGTGKTRMGVASCFGKPQADADLSHTQ